MTFNKGSELDKQIYKEGESTWGCKSGVLDVEDVEYVREYIKLINYDSTKLLALFNQEKLTSIDLREHRRKINEKAGKKLSPYSEDSPKENKNE